MSELMVDQFGNEIESMTKEEADASVEEMGRMMEYFDGICEYCWNQRKKCPIECIDMQRAKKRGMKEETK